MADKIEITRTQVIVVKKVWEGMVGAYPYLFWSDEKDKEYKVSATRKKYFEGVVEANRTILLSYAMNPRNQKEYVASAEEVKDKLPTMSKDAKVEALEAEQMRKGNPRPSYDPQRKSIERQTAIKSSVELNRGMPGTTAATAIMDAQLIEYYLETGALKGQPKIGSTRLVEEAMKLGARETTEDIPF